MLKNLTQHEIPRLPETFNLADGHVHRKWSALEEKVVQQAEKFFREANREMQPDLEDEYIQTFFSLAQQSIDPEKTKFLLCTSASMSLEIVANYLRTTNSSLGLIEPCFDNLADIFRRHNVPLEALNEALLDSPSLRDALNQLKSQAICIVTPNNPTGTLLTHENLQILVEHCKQKNKLLILDTSFRFYTPADSIYDQYKILSESGINYIVVEDTGKTWPTQELKLSILAMSKNLFQPIYDIYTDFILHVSPFAVKLLTEFLKTSVEDKLQYVHGIVRRNRDILYKNLEGTLLTPTERPYSSVAWLKVDGMKAFGLKQILDEKGIFVLPGDYFCWSDKAKCEMYIRVALTREPAVFEQAAKKLGEIAQSLKI